MTSTPTATARRADIEFLRVIAVLGVMIFHFGPDLALTPNGYLGVDVFFTISGFVITQQMLKARDRGVLTYSWFLSRRIRRLLPSAVLVILVTMLFVAVLGNPVYVEQQSRAAMAALLYASNFYFAAQAVDYFGADGAESPYLHYWSLAVEEQFYIVWPLLILALVWMVKRRNRPASFGPVVLSTIVVLGALSVIGGTLAYAANPSQAFFMPWWRAHQLLLGAGVAVWLWWRPPMPLSLGKASTWAVRLVRLGAVVLLLALYVAPNYAVPSPSFQSALVSVPVAFILATYWVKPSDALNRWGALRPLAYIAAISYVLYLWHWPVWVLLRDQWPTASPAVLMAAAFAISFALAALTHRWVEVPFRTASWARTLQNRRVIVVGLSASVAAAVLASFAPILAPIPQWQQNLTPSLATAGQDKAPAHRDGCFINWYDTDLEICRAGDAANASKKVFLLGDSHAAQWQTALNDLAPRNDFSVAASIKAFCPIWSVDYWNVLAKKPYTQCDQWREDVFALVDREKPDVVVVSGLTPWANVRDGGRVPTDEERPALIKQGITDTIDRLERSAGQVVVMLDTPSAPAIPAECLAEAAAVEDCAYESDRSEPGRIAVERAVKTTDAVMINPYDRVCPDEVCAVVEGSTLMYLDRGHLTATYMRELEPWVSTWLKPALRS